MCGTDEWNYTQSFSIRIGRIPNLVMQSVAIQIICVRHMAALLVTFYIMYSKGIGQLKRVVLVFLSTHNFSIMDILIFSLLWIS